MSLASGQVHLPYLVHSLQMWYAFIKPHLVTILNQNFESTDATCITTLANRHETCPMWGEKGGPQVYVDAFLRWIERKFWAHWWPRKGKPVGLSLDDFIEMTWGATEVSTEMDHSGASSKGQPPIEIELGLEIAAPERKERGVLLSRNSRFLSFDVSAPRDRPTTCMRTGGGGAELVWLASRRNRVLLQFSPCSELRSTQLLFLLGGFTIHFSLCSNWTVFDRTSRWRAFTYESTKR